MFSWLFVWYLTTDFSFIAEYPSAMWDPLPLLKFLGLSAQPSGLTVTLLKTLWLASMFFAAIGLFTRSAITVAFFLGFYLLAATHSFYKINHSDAGLLFATGVLMFARCGDAFSIDVLRRAAKARGGLIIQPSGEYNWPIHLVRLVWVIIFFLAGVAKLRRSGFDWMFADNMIHLIMRKQETWEPPTSMGTWFVQHPWTCQAMSTGAVIIEILSPLVLFSKIARLIIVPAMLGMQVGIRLIMGDDFTQFMTIYVFFVPWLLVGALMLRFSPGKTIQVLYDGDCGLCGKTVALLRRIDLLSQIRFRDIVSDWNSIQEEYPRIDRDSAYTDMHVIDRRGNVTCGFEAYRQIAWVVPLGWLMLPILYLPGVSIIGRRVYRRIANQRLSDSVCRI